jgi:hypothetical protein
MGNGQQQVGDRVQLQGYQVGGISKLVAQTDRQAWKPSGHGALPTQSVTVAGATLEGDLCVCVHCCIARPVSFRTCVLTAAGMCSIMSGPTHRLPIQLQLQMVPTLMLQRT